MPDERVQDEPVGGLAVDQDVVPEAPFAGPPTVSTSPKARRWSRVATFVVLALAGLLFAASALTSGGTNLRAESGSDLRDLVAKRAQQVAVLQGQVTDLQQEVQDLSDTQGGGPALARQRQRAADLAPAAGFTPVVGPSLTVVLNDAPKQPISTDGTGPTPDDLVVHQQDVQAVVNALWQGGASAMRIMDQRIISTSAVRCVGNTLLLQGRVYSPPFTITAVGDATKMRKALDDDPTVSVYREYVTLYGLGYEVAEAASTTLPAYEGPLSIRYARPTAP